MIVGDKVICKNGGTAVIISIDEKYKTAEVIFLKTGMYMPETFFLNELKIDETR